MTMPETRKSKLRRLLSALGPSPAERDGFVAFDEGIAQLKKDLTKAIKTSTLEEVDATLNKVRTQMDLKPLLEKLEGIKSEFDTTLQKLAEEFDTRSSQFETEGSDREESSRRAASEFRGSVEALHARMDSELAGISSAIGPLREKMDSFGSDFPKSVDTERSQREEALTHLNALLNQETSDRAEEDERLDKKIDANRVEVIDRISRVSPHGGGNANRNISVGGNSSVLSRYTDINLKAGANVTLTYANNDQTKNVDITITATGGGGGGGITRSINNIAVDTTAGSVSGTDYVYLCAGTLTLTLPTAAGNSNLYTVKNVGAGVITVATTGGETIDADTTITMPIQFTSVDLISNTAAWMIT